MTPMMSLLAAATTGGEAPPPSLQDMTPDSDVSVGWSVVGAAAHYDALDDDPDSPDLNDYIESETEEYVDELGLSNPGGAATALTVELYGYVEGPAAQVDVDLYTGSGWEGYQNCIPAQSPEAKYTAVFNGNWSEADLDQAKLRIRKTEMGHAVIYAARVAPS